VTRRPLHLVIALIAVAAMLPSVALGATKKHHKVPQNCVSAECVYVELGDNPFGTNFGFYPLPPWIEKRLAEHGGKDRQLLETLATRQMLEPVRGAYGGNGGSPGAFLAALDLGAGPIALFAILVGGAAAFAVGRELRRRRRVLRF
jgi:hypothetical protein